MIQRLLTIFCTIILLGSCSVEESTYLPSGDSSQTTLIYFAGTSLNTAFESNISDIKTAVARGELGTNGRILYHKRLSSSTSRLYEIYKSGSSSVEVEEVNSYYYMDWNESSSLTQVINDVKSHIGFTNDSTSTINLVISGHGTGWVPQEYPSLTKMIAGEVSIESMWEPAAQALPTRFIGSSSDGFMDIEEVQLGIEDSGTKLGYMIFDACLMSSIESLYRLRDCADYIISSPAEVMSYGFPYDNIFKYMFDNNGLDFNVEMICEEYYNFYSSYVYPYGTIAACLTSELEGLADEVYKLTLNSLSTSEVSALQTYEGLYTHVFYDLGDYISTASSDDLTQYQKAFDKAFPPECRFHTARFYSALDSYGAKVINSYSGVSTSAPSSLFKEEWLEEPWTQAIMTGVN